MSEKAESSKLRIFLESLFLKLKLITAQLCVITRFQPLGLENSPDGFNSNFIRGRVNNVILGFEFDIQRTVHRDISL